MPSMCVSIHPEHMWFTAGKALSLSVSLLGGPYHKFCNYIRTITWSHVETYLMLNVNPLCSCSLVLGLVILCISQS